MWRHLWWPLVVTGSNQPTIESLCYCGISLSLAFPLLSHSLPIKGIKNKQKRWCTEAETVLEVKDKKNKKQQRAGIPKRSTVPLRAGLPFYWLSSKPIGLGGRSTSCEITSHVMCVCSCVCVWCKSRNDTTGWLYTNLHVHLTGRLRLHFIDAFGMTPSGKFRKFRKMRYQACVQMRCGSGGQAPVCRAVGL